MRVKVERENMTADLVVWQAFGRQDEGLVEQVLALNPGVSREEVQDNTGFDLIFDDTVAVTEPPTSHELETLRMLDPERLFTA